MKPNTRILAIAMAAATTACAESQPADAVPARAPASVQVTPEREPVHVTVRAVDQEGTPAGEARALQLTPEAGDPGELGLTPVPAGTD
ncbi:MAG TPA: hypothetical protein VFR81_06495 [Longimicrobium sp.]|nr:hypothetical protein [Longimicrobium sp.]